MSGTAAPYCKRAGVPCERPLSVCPSWPQCPDATPDDGYVPATDRNLVAERRARLDKADRLAAERAAGKGRIRGRKTGDPRLDRERHRG